MKNIRNAVVGVVATSAALASLLLGVGPASAAPACNAPAGKYCFAVRAGDNGPGEFQSVRVGGYNGPCQLGPFFPNQNTYYPGTYVDVSQKIDVVFYNQDGKCGAGRSVLSYTMYPVGQGGNTWNGGAGTLDGRWAVLDRP